MDCCVNVISKAENRISFKTNALKGRIAYTCNRFSVYWKNSNRTRSVMFSRHNNWLSEEDTVKLDVMSTISKPENSLARGRPRKEFDLCSPRSKRRRISELSSVDPLACQFMYNSHKKTDSNPLPTIDPDEVVCLIVETKLTKHQYMTLKKFVNNKFSGDVLPSYQKILKAKTKCYPEKRNVTETLAEVELQSLLDHTASRIVESLPVSTKNDLAEGTTAILIGKWGFDGSTGHSEYKQSFSDSTAEDSSMFVTSYVPLRLMVCDKVLWKNNTPSSTRFCRPIRLQVAKETKELTVNEERYIKEQINKLTPSNIKFKSCSFQVNHKLQLTMIDGKCCNALSETSSCRYFFIYYKY